MAVEMLLGAPGAGKSYHAVSQYVLSNLRSGRKVITNLPLKPDKIAERLPDVDLDTLLQVTPPEDENNLRWFARAEHYHDDWQADDGKKAFIIIDEAADLMPKGQTPEALKEFYRKHRHSGFDILLITQHETMVEPGIRHNVANTIWLENLEDVGVKRYSYTRYSGSGVRGTITAQQTYKYKSDIFELYQSRTLGGGEGQNRRMIGVTRLWLKFPFLLLYASIGLTVFIFTAMNPFAVFGVGKDPEPTELEHVSAAPVRTPGRTQQRTEVQRAASRSQFYLVGVVRRGGGTAYLIKRGAGAVRKVQAGRLSMMGIQVRETHGCALYKLQDAAPPTLVLCGDPL